MGYRVGERCFATNTDAADFWFSGKDPSYTAGETSYVSWFERVGTVWQIKRQSISSTGAITNLASANATVPTFSACDVSEQFMDGFTIGWAIAGAMVAAYAVKFIAKALRNDADA